jgi:hypothetical protein
MTSKNASKMYFSDLTSRALSKPANLLFTTLNAENCIIAYGLVISIVSHIINVAL